MKNPAEDLQLLPATKARALLGVSTTTLWRYEHDESLDFPRAIEIRKRKFYRQSELADWITSQTATKDEAAAKAEDEEAAEEEASRHEEGEEEEEDAEAPEAA